MFAVKCASYLFSGVSVIIVDVVTERSGNLHAELLQVLHTQVPSAAQDQQDLYGTAYRAIPSSNGLELQTWVYPLLLGAALPTLPLWLQSDLCLPLDLESTYQAACAARRIGD